MLNAVKWSKVYLLSMLECCEVFAAFLIDKFIKIKKFYERKWKALFLIKIFLLRLRIEVFYLPG